MRKKFPLDSNQLELLLAFHTAGSLSELANLMHKDISVVSRGLQKLTMENLRALYARVFLIASVLK